jgi:hypothetical protein
VTGFDSVALASQNLQNIYVSDGNTHYSSIDGVLFYKEYDATKLVRYPAGNTRTNYEVPDGVVEIYGDAFLGSHNLTDIYISEGVKNIDDTAFSHCARLASITRPSSVADIGIDVFIGSPNAQFGRKLVIKCQKGSRAHQYAQANGITFDLYDGTGDEGIGEDTGGETAEGVIPGTDLRWSLNKTTGDLEIDGTGDIPFMPNGEKPWDAHGVSIQRIAVGDGVTGIADRAFFNQESLLSVSIGNGVQTIGEYAFSGCYALSDISVGSGVRTIGYEAFSYCDALTTIVIPDNVETVGDLAFYGCNEIQTLSIGSGVESIGAETFSSSKMKSLYINMKTASGRPFLGKMPYNDYTTDVTFGPDVESIAGFGNYLALTEIDVPDGVTRIDERTFAGCRSLTSIIIPSGVKSIDESAFEGSDNVVIHCDENSAAHIFAKNNGVSFVLSGGGESNPGGKGGGGNTGGSGRNNNKNNSSDSGDKGDQSAVNDDVTAAPDAADETRDVEKNNTQTDRSDNMRISFTDVSRNDWFYDDVVYVCTLGLFNGMSATEFSPNTFLTRAMFATLLYRYDGGMEITDETRFSDVDGGQWYTDAVRWSSGRGIVKGYGDNIFGINDFMTREQLVTILYRYANLNGFDVTKLADISNFTDSSEISEFALDAMMWANANGIINGNTNTTLNPKGCVTRSETAVLLKRFIDISG